jgi:tRNA A-37 threonylcarbamoyl transferase component Bud32
VVAPACIDDEALFALARGELSGSELAQAELHLRDCADCRAVLAEAARAIQSSSTSDAQLLDDSAPTQIDRYQVVSLIGAGASGVVYRGFDPQLKRTVALKVLRHDLHGERPDQSQRMLREAQAMARLSDPHVVAVYDVGLHQGTVYLVMEYIDGATLSAWLQAKKRSRAEILAVFADAARGLSAAHHKGLVHRDFKPENVLVAHDGRARVTDFGLARESDNWLEDRATDEQASTELYAPTRGLIGTPAYMAPELFEGGRASSQSDQFAFSVALFVALFDKHPFKAGEGIALSELVTRVRASTLQVPVLHDGVDERLFEVLRRGLSVSPGDRYPDLPALSAALGVAVRVPRRRLIGIVAVALAVVGAPLAWLAAAPRSVPVGASEPSTTLARSARVAALERAPRDVPAEPAPAPSAVAAVPSVTPSAARGPVAPRKRRPEPKPGEVRYKDWLKEPF